MFNIIESVIYVLSIFYLIISFLNIKKSSEKLNLIHWIIISLLLLFCYNTFIVFILSLLNIHSNLIVLSIINLLVSLLFNRFKRQQYFILKKDVVALLTFFVITIVIMLLRFGIPFKLSYETCDPGIHFWTAKDFYEQSILLNKVSDKTVVDFSTRQTASYTNVGLFFKVVAPFTDSFNLYIFYIIYDLYMLFISGMIFYILISKCNFILAMILSIMYFLGYPLNNMIFGFFYSGHAVTLICLLFILIKYIDNKKLFIPLLSLLCFTLFFTYYFYVPVVFISLFSYLLYRNIKIKKKIIDKNFIINNLAIFLLPCIFGIMYFILPNMNNPETSIVTQINLNGYYYNNVISNFTLLIPLIILSFICNKKELKLEHFMFGFLIIFMTIILYLMATKNAVGYYLSKNYYLLWLLSFIIISNLFTNFYSKYKTIIKTYLIFMIVMIVAVVTGFEQRIIDLEDWSINKTTPSNLFDVYRFNYNTIMYQLPDFTPGELNMLHEAYKLGATDLQSNAYYDYVDRRAWLSAWFRKEKIVNTTENKLFTFLTESHYIDILPLYDSKEDFDPSVIDFSQINMGKYDWYLFMYNKTRKKDVDKRDYFVAEGRYYYDALDRNECKNCKFYDFNEGLLIHR